MSKITYANKVALYENSDIADINKVKADDMNEIKTCVNNNDDMLTGGAVAGNMVVESIRTKNMFDKNSVLVGQLLKTYGNGGTEANADWNSSYYITVEPNTTYTYTTVNPGTTTNQIIINQYNGTTFVTGSQYNQTGGGTFSYTFTTGSTTTNVRLGYRNANNYQNIQLEEGSSATDYTPYQALNITQEEYSLTLVYTSITPIYKLRRFDNMCVLEVNAIYFSSITANTWVSVASIPSEIIPPYSVGGSLIQANSSNGNIEGYGRVELQNNGNIRVKTTSTSNAPFFTFTLLWFIIK